MLVGASDVMEHFAFPGNIDFAADYQGAWNRVFKLLQSTHKHNKQARRRGGFEGFERTPFAGQFVNLFEGLNLEMMKLQKFALRNGIVLLWVDKLYK